MDQQAKKPAASRRLSKSETEEIRAIQATMRQRKEQIADAAIVILQQQEKQAAVYRALATDEQRLIARIKELASKHGIEEKNAGKWLFDASAAELAFRRTD